MFNLVVFLLTTANAGKLADDNGFRGKSFGPASVLSEAPMEGCLEGAEEDSAWRCETTIGEHPVTVNYIVDEDLFGAVILNASGYTACEGVKSVLTQAWGKPVQPNRYIERYPWTDGRVVASWDYNKATSGCNIVIANMSVYAEQKKAKASKAATAVGDL
jgi:hypothetical protein